MIRPEDVRLEKVMEVLEGLGLTEEELGKAESYLRGEAGEEILQGFTYRELGKAEDNARYACKALASSLENKKRYTEMMKLLKILFAVGLSTCAEVFTNDLYVLKKEEVQQEVKMERAQLTAIYAHELCEERWSYRLYQLDSLYEMAGSKPENLLKAFDYYKGNGNGSILLYATYFWKKYSKNTVVEVQDKELLKNYENMIVRNISMIFTSSAQIAPELVEELKEWLVEGKNSEQLLLQVKGLPIIDMIYRLLGGYAYLNYMLSDVLKRTAMLCAAIDAKKALSMFQEMSGRYDFTQKGGDYDEIFDIDATDLIAWLAEHEKSIYNYGQHVQGKWGKKLLAAQFAKNRQQFLDYQKRASLEGSNCMLEVVKELDKELYDKLLNEGAQEQKEKVIRMITERLTVKNDCMEYLRGNTELEALELIADQMKGSMYSGSNEWIAMINYCNRYQDDDFKNRCMIVMALSGVGYFFREPIFIRGVDRKIVDEAVQDIFKGLDAGRFSLARQLQTFVLMNDTMYAEKEKENYLEIVKPIFTKYLQERPEETKKAFAEGEAYGRYFGLCVLEQAAEAYKAEILAFSQDTAKIVKEKLEAILKEKQQWHLELEAMLNAKKAAEREMAIRVMVHWNQPEDLERLRKLLETEKNAKVRNLLESVVGSGDEENGTGTGNLSIDELVTNLHKGGKKRNLAWAYGTPFSEVHRKSGEVAGEEYLQAILLCYTGMTTPGVSKDAKMLAEGLQEAEFAVYVNELFDKWLEAGAEAKKRWVMYAASIHGGSDIVKRLYHQIQEWPLMSRGAIAADAVQALALNPQPQALLLVDGIARKFKFKQVKAAAGKALEFAAAQLGLTREELEDKIVPNLGFDENMERKFDYGERSFIVTITPALEIEIFDTDGKKLKNLPAPGKKDDEEKANAAYADFKEMKKQMKATISSQKQRLEAALSSERLWSIAAWQNLFVKNPVMHQFAIGLIWGIYEEHKLTQSFRYMEDGSFNTEEEEEFTLPEQGYIGLVHPIELTQESKEAWKQQLEDYEIAQPIEQLNREIFYRTQEELTGKSMERFGGMYINDLSLNGKMQQLGWYRGDIMDAGCFDTFYRTDASLGLCAELHFSGTYVGGQDEDVTVYEARFYKLDGRNNWGYHIADEAKDTKALMLKDIPERYFSEIVLQLTKATSSSKEKDEDWKKNR